MTETSVLELSEEWAPSNAAPMPRPDVAVVIGTGDEHLGLRTAAAKARRSGGKVCVIRCIDNAGIGETHRMIERSADARSQLATVISSHSTEFAPERVWSRLHIGSLQSLLTTLEPSIGAVVVEGPATDAPGDLETSCPAAIEFVQ